MPLSDPTLTSKHSSPEFAQSTPPLGRTTERTPYNPLAQTLILHLAFLLALFTSFYFKGSQPTLKPVKPIKVIHLPRTSPPVKQPTVKNTSKSAQTTTIKSTAANAPPTQKTIAKQTKNKAPQTPSKVTAPTNGKKTTAPAASVKQKVANNISKLNSIQQQIEKQLTQIRNELEDFSSSHEADTSAHAPENLPKSQWIVTILQSWLSLPEYGTVELLIELSDNGTILKLEILETESQVNAEYLIKNLSHSKLPLIFERDEPKTYILMLSHDDFF